MSGQIIKVFDAVDSLMGTFAEELFYFSAKSPDKANVALSGGSTPKALFHELAKPANLDKIHWAIFNFFWGDERLVSYENPESNYGEANRILLSNIRDTRQGIFPVPVLSSPKEAALLYEVKIREIVKQVNNGIPVFDWIILGIGTDGHTASLFSGAKWNEDENPLTFVAKHPVTGQKRISFIYNLINQAQRVTFLVTGKEKAQVIEQILNKKPEAENYPAAKIQPENGIIEWYLDSEAAGLLQL